MVHHYRGCKVARTTAARLTTAYMLARVVAMTTSRLVAGGGFEPPTSWL